jgi:hypothetical protein
VSRETPQAHSAEEAPEAARGKRTPGTETNRGVYWCHYIFKIMVKSNNIFKKTLTFYYFKKLIDRSFSAKYTCYNLFNSIVSKITTLIKSGRGTGPMTPGNLSRSIEKVLIPTEQLGSGR